MNPLNCVWRVVKMWARNSVWKVVTVRLFKCACKAFKMGPLKCACKVVTMGFLNSVCKVVKMGYLHSVSKVTWFVSHSSDRISCSSWTQSWKIKTHFKFYKITGQHLPGRSSTLDRLKWFLQVSFQIKFKYSVLNFTEWMCQKMEHLSLTGGLLIAART